MANSKLEGYAIRYAKAVAERNTVNLDIKILLEAADEKRCEGKSFNEIFNMEGRAIDLSDVKTCYEVDSGDHWHGWVYAVCFWNDQHDEGDDSYYSPDSDHYRLAEMLDRKAAIRSEIGVCRRSICAIGRGLI